MNSGREFLEGVYTILRQNQSKQRGEILTNYEREILWIPREKIFRISEKQFFQMPKEILPNSERIFF